MKRLLYLLVLIAFAKATFGQVSDWTTKLQTIKVAESSREQVEHLFRSAKIERETNYALMRSDGWGLIVEYKTEFGTLEVTYSTGRCSETTSTSGYDLDSDKVVQVIFEPDTPGSPKEFGFDLRRFEMERVEDVADSYVYYQRETGTVLSIYKGKINAIEFGLSREQMRLKCNK